MKKVLLLSSIILANISMGMDAHQTTNEPRQYLENPYSARLLYSVRQNIDLNHLPWDESYEQTIINAHKGERTWKQACDFRERSDSDYAADCKDTFTNLLSSNKEIHDTAKNRIKKLKNEIKGDPVRQALYDYGLINYHDIKQRRRTISEVANGNRFVSEEELTQVQNQLKKVEEEKNQNALVLAKSLNYVMPVLSPGKQISLNQPDISSVVKAQQQFNTEVVRKIREQDQKIAEQEQRISELEKMLSVQQGQQNPLALQDDSDLIREEEVSHLIINDIITYSGILKSQGDKKWFSGQGTIIAKTEDGVEYSMLASFTDDGKLDFGKRITIYFFGKQSNKSEDFKYDIGRFQAIVPYFDFNAVNKFSFSADSYKFFTENYLLDINKSYFMLGEKYENLINGFGFGYNKDENKIMVGQCLNHNLCTGTVIKNVAYKNEIIKQGDLDYGDVYNGTLLENNIIYNVKEGKKADLYTGEYKDVFGNKFYVKDGKIQNEETKPIVEEVE